jgi:hypothetical protein
VLPLHFNVVLLWIVSNGGVRSNSSGIPKLELTLQLQGKFTAEVYSSQSSWRIDASPRTKQKEVGFNRLTSAFFGDYMQ